MKRIEKLSKEHHLDDFNCGVGELNQFLSKRALQNQGANSSTTYLALDNKEVIGFYSLAIGSVIHANAPKRISKGLARHPIPVMLLARLATSSSWQRNGIGRGLLKDALIRTLEVSEIAGVRALLVHAKNDFIKKWYLSLDFEVSPTDPLHLFLLTKDIIRTLHQ